MVIVMLNVFCTVHEYLRVYEKQNNIHLQYSISIEFYLKLNIFIFQNLSNTSNRSTFLENYKILNQLETLS